MEQEGLINGKRKAISNWFRQFMTIIDPGKRLFWQKEGLFGLFSWGSARVLPAIDYVLVFRQFFAKCEACAFDEKAEDGSTYYQVSLVHHKNRRIIVHETRSRLEAFDMARNLSEKLRARLRDSATTRGKSVWIN